MRNIFFSKLIFFQVYATHGIRFGDVFAALFCLFNLKVCLAKIISFLPIIIPIILYYFIIFISGHYVNILFVFNKLIITILFILVLAAGLCIKSDQINSIVNFSIISSVVFSLILNIFVILFDPQDLIGHICNFNRHQFFGVVRCGSFDEGSYFGSFLVLYSILAANNPKILFFSLIGVFISGSPIPILLVVLLILTCKNLKLINKSLFLFILAIFFFLNTSIFSHFDKINFFNDDIFINESGSFLERFEFLRAGLRIFSDNIFLGVGPGQYNFYLANYTNFSHLIIYSNFQRYIPNSPYSELISEYGLIGLFYLIIIPYIFIFKAHVKKFHVFIILIIWLQLPTFFTTWHALFIGLIINKYSYKNKF